MRRDILETVSMYSKNAESVGEFNVDCESYPAKREFSMHIKQWLDIKDDIITLRLPAASERMLRPRVTKRRLPFFTNFGTDITEHWTFNFNEKVETLLMPEGFTYSLDNFADIKVWQPKEETTDSDDKTRITWKREFSLKRSMITPEQYDDYVVSALKTQGRRADTIVVRRLQSERLVALMSPALSCSILKKFFSHR